MVENDGTITAQYREIIRDDTEFYNKRIVAVKKQIKCIVSDEPLYTNTLKKQFETLHDLEIASDVLESLQEKLRFHDSLR